MRHGEVAGASGPDFSERQAVRLRRLCVRAEVRYLRRKLAVDWFWAWCRMKWQHQPSPTTKVTATLAETVPALSSSPARQTHVCYEDLVALQDEAFMLLNRLLLKQKGGRDVDISRSEREYLRGREEGERQEPLHR